MEQQNDPRIRRIEEKLVTILEQGRDRVFEHEIYDILRIIGYPTPATSFTPSRAELSNLDIKGRSTHRSLCPLPRGIQTV